MRYSLRTRYLAVGLLLATMLVVLAHANSQQITVTGTVTVPCQFSLSIAPNALVYLEPAQIGLSYNAFSTMNCTTALATGNIILSNSVSSAIYNSMQLSLVGIKQSPLQSGTASFPSNAQMAGTVKATITLSSSTNTNSASAQFTIVTPANLTMSQFSASPNPASPGSTVAFTSNVMNNGGIAGTNVILHIKITGPNAFSYSTTSLLQSLSPAQYETASIVLTGVSGTAGTYTAVENVSYNSTFTYNSMTTNTMLVSGNITAQYTVSSGPQPGPGPVGGGGGGYAPPPPPKSTGGISLAQFPIYMSIFPTSNVSVQFIGMTNNRSYSQWVNFTVVQPSYGMVALSSGNVLVGPHSTSYITMAINTSDSAQPGSYLQILGMGVSAPGMYSNATLFTRVDVLQNATKPAVSTTVELLNNSKDALIQYNVFNPTNETYSNLMVSTSIPAVALSANSVILQSGLLTTAQLINGTYYLSCGVPVLEPHQFTATPSAFITNISKTNYIISPTVSFSQSPSPQPQSIFNLLVLNATPVFINGTSLVRLEALYTGSTPANIIFNIIPPAGVHINSTFSSYAARPNQEITQYFKVGPLAQAGSQLFTIKVNVSGQVREYNLPILVQQQLPAGYASVQPNIIALLSLAPIILLSLLALALVPTAAVLFGRRMAQHRNRRFNENRRITQIKTIRRRLKAELPP